MYFDWNWKVNDFLFENFNIDSIEKCVLIIFIVFAMGYLTELIKVFQKYLNKKVQLKFFEACGTQSEITPLVNSLRIPTDHSIIKKMRLRNHLIQSLIYVINLIIGYFLMLIVMGMYAGNFIGTILGFGFGYYFLHVLSPDFYESISNKNITINDEEDYCPRTSNYDQI